MNDRRRIRRLHGHTRRKESVDDLRRCCVEAYLAQFAREPDVYTFKVANGASELTG